MAGDPEQFAKIEELINKATPIIDSYSEIQAFVHNFSEWKEQCNTVLTSLYGDPRRPGLQGDIPEIKSHLKAHNNFSGRLANLEGKVKIITLIISCCVLGGGGFGISQLV